MCYISNFIKSIKFVPDPIMMVCLPEIIEEEVVEIGKYKPTSPLHPIKFPNSKSELVQAD